MARNNRVRSNQHKSGEAKSGFSSIVVAIITAAAALGGVFIQGYFDIIGTNRELVIQYSKAANESSKSVEKIVADLISELGDPNARVSPIQMKELKNALLELRRDAELLNIQAGSAATLFQSYERSMADLSEAAQNVTGPADAKGFIEALSAFYAAKRTFEEQIASKYHSTSI